MPAVLQNVLLSHLTFTYNIMYNLWFLTRTGTSRSITRPTTIRLTFSLRGTNQCKTSITRIPDNVLELVVGSSHRSISYLTRITTTDSYMVNIGSVLVYVEVPVISMAGKKRFQIKTFSVTHCCK